LKTEIADHDAACPPIVPTAAQAERCNSWARQLDARKAALEARLGELGVEILPPGAEPPPGQPGAPGAEEPPGTPEETPSFPPPREITGLTKHGSESVEAHDGHGVNDSALQDAFEHPIQPPRFELDELGRGAYVYEGEDAVVVLNKDGQVVTAWPRNHNGWRHP
jgi:hypothetical protein